MNEEIAALNVRLEATLARFERDLARATRQVERNTARMNTSLKRVDTTVGQLKKGMRTLSGVIGSVASAVVIRQLDAMARRLDEIGKTADKLGFTTDALQGLRAAAEDSGIGVRTADLALQRFTRRVAEARQGTGEAKAALKELGIEFRTADGRAKSMEELLADVADAMAAIEDPADRVRLAFKLFDSEGVSFVNLLSKGSEGLRDLQQNARDTGEVIEESLIRQAEETVTQLGRLDRVIDADLARAFGSTQPLLVAFKEGLAGAAGFAADLADEIRRIGAGTNELQPFIADLPALREQEQAIERQEQLLARRAALADRIANGQDTANNRLALTELDAEIAAAQPPRDLPSTRGARGASARGRRTPAPTVLPTLTVSGGSNEAGAGRGRSTRQADPFGPAAAGVRERIARMQLERDALDQTAEAAARAAIEYEVAALRRELLTQAQQSGGGVSAEEQATIDNLVAEYEQLSLAIAATEQNQRTLEDAQRAADDAAKRQAQSIEALGNRFASAVQSADDLRGALKNVAIELLNITAQGLGGTGPLSGILGGLLSGFLGGGGGFSFGALSGIGSINASGTSPALSFPGFAAGTNFAPGGPAIVGEDGPELLDLPRGSRVTPNAETMRMLSGSSVMQTVNIHVDGVATDEVVGRIRDETMRGFQQLRNEIPGRAVAGIERSPDLRRRLR